MNILVTGAAGFVGNHLVRELKANGHSVTATMNNAEQAPTDADNSVAADLMNSVEVRERIDFTKLDGVIHLAGLAAVGPSYDDPVKYLTVNPGIEANLYQACVDQGAKPRFLIVSSGSLYDGNAPMPITEQSPIDPASPYAVSKMSQEALAQYYAKRGFPYVIVRPFNHVGPGQNEGFIVPDLAKQIVAAERNELAEIAVGNLDARRDYTDVRDIVRAYRLLIESDVSGEIFNICSGRSLSGHEILKMLLGKSMAQIAIKQDPARMRPSDIAEIVGNHDKLTTTTGWQPSYDIEQTLTDALEDWRNR